MKIEIVNPTDRSWTRHRFILWFGACGTTRLMVWANGLESALDACVDWIADHAPGLLADEQVTDEYNRLRAENPSASDEWCQEQATVDTTCAGNAGHYLLSWEWGIVAEDPTRAEIKRMIAE